MVTQTEKERVIQIILEMPDEEVLEVAEFVDSLDKDLGSPESVKVRSLEELRLSIQEAMKNVENGEFSPADEVFSRLEKKYC